MKSFLILCILYHCKFCANGGEATPSDLPKLPEVQRRNGDADSASSRDEEIEEQRPSPLQYKAADQDPPVKLPKMYEKEIMQGVVPDLFGSNHHSFVSSQYSAFNRRFVPFYKYVEDKQHKTSSPEELELNVLLQLDGAIKTAQQERSLAAVNEINAEDEVVSNIIIPKKAPPQVVFKVAALAAAREASRPRNPDDAGHVKEALRTGKYWDSLWKEEVTNAELSLRSNQDSLRVKIMPGTRLHQLATVAQRISPTLLYVIKKRDF